MRLPAITLLPLAALPLMRAAPAAVQGEAAQESPLGELIARASAGALPTAAEIAEALLELGPDGARRWFRALDLRRPDRELQFPEEASDVLAPEALAGLRAATAGVPALILAGQEGRDLDQHLVCARVALAILAELGDADQMELVRALGAPHPQADLYSYRPVGVAFRGALSEVLRRDALGFPEATGFYARCHPWMQTFLLRGLGDTRDRHALQALPHLLGAVRELDYMVLTEIGKIAQDVSTPLDEYSLILIREYLSSNDPQERQQAAASLGRLDDYESVSALIDLLKDPHAGVRYSAYWSLQRITTMTINSESRRWRIWFDGETSWWTSEGPALLSTIYGAEELSVVVGAINTCGSKRLFRRQLTPELVPLLGHSEPAVVRMTCSALLSLRATEAVPDLIDVLEQADPQVRERAWTALRGLTGLEDLPPEPGAWRAATSRGSPSAK